MQHPGEEKRNLKTAPMLLNGLESGCCVIYYGKKFPTRKHEGLAELLSEPNTFVLFPGVKSRCLKQVVQSYSAGEQYNLVLIDGTWSQAKSIYFHSPFLHDLPQVNRLIFYPFSFGRNMTKTYKHGENMYSTIKYLRF